MGTSSEPVNLPAVVRVGRAERPTRHSPVSVQQSVQRWESYSHRPCILGRSFGFLSVVSIATIISHVEEVTPASHELAHRSCAFYLSTL